MHQTFPNIHIIHTPYHKTSINASHLSVKRARYLGYANEVGEGTVVSFHLSLSPRTFHAAHKPQKHFNTLYLHFAIKIAHLSLNRPKSDSFVLLMDFSAVWLTQLIPSL